MIESRTRASGYPVGAAIPRANRMPKAELLRRQRGLERAPMFEGLPKRHLQAIARVTLVRTYPAGSVLIREGESESSFVVILDGTVTVQQGGRTVARGSAGDFFGEISLLDPGPRTASVIAQTDVTSLDLAGRDFQRILSGEPALAIRLLKGMAHRFRIALPPLG